jgi:hypothetical protein
VLVRRIPGFKSAGDALLVAAYAAINLAITFTNVDVKGMGALGHRLGWFVLIPLVESDFFFFFFFFFWGLD